ncbi:MAG: FAD-binding protein [Clostridia bacterium]|nr:FAD-binding protein [Clostridia bacterium]
MKILVCVRIGPDGEINPFDACAYELALSVNNAEVSLLSMGPISVKSELSELTRLGAKVAYLLFDNAFAGADTLATSYTLSLAVKKLNPDLIICGRQTLIGDTAQTPVMLAEKVGYSLITGVMGVNEISENRISCKTREDGDVSVQFPALITVERINTLRLPSIRSKTGDVITWTAADIAANPDRCGLAGSPTRVIQTTENTSGRRKCKYISADELEAVIKSALKNSKNNLAPICSKSKLNKVLSVTNAPIEYAKTVSDNIIVIDENSVDSVINAINLHKPSAVLFGSDAISKRVSARVAAKLDLGLCADCTALETDGKTLYMIRPALSGSVMAKIKSEKMPAMATVRTIQDKSRVVVSAGYGVKDCIDVVKKFADSLGGVLCASRKAVDNNLLPYELQVGLTGKKVSPALYIAIGISGAVHHIVGMDKSGTVIAINPDKDAPIFDYADYGIVDKFENIFGGTI